MGLRHRCACLLTASFASAMASPAFAQLLPPLETDAPGSPAPQPPPSWPWGLRRASAIGWLYLAARGSLSHVAGAGGASTTGSVLSSYDAANSGNLGLFAYRYRLYWTLGG